MGERQLLEALLGVYVGIFLVTVGVLVGREFGVTGLPRGALVVTGIVIAAVVMAVARRVEDLVDRVVSIPVAAVTVGVPLAYLPYMILAAEPESGAAIVALVGLLAVVPGVGIPIAGGFIRNKRRREQATEIVAVTVGEEDEDDGWLPNADDSWIAGIGVAVVGVGILAVGIGLTLGFDGSGSSGTIFTSLSGLATSLLLFVDDSSKIVVTDTGLRIDQQFLLWDELTGYRLTDETVEIVTPNWYQSTREFDREDISNEEACIDGLGEFLPRVDEHERVEVSPQRRQ